MQVTIFYRQLNSFACLNSLSINNYNTFTYVDISDYQCNTLKIENKQEYHYHSTNKYAPQRLVIDKLTYIAFNLIQYSH